MRLIKNVKILTAAEKNYAKGSIIIENGKIAELEPPETAEKVCFRLIYTPYIDSFSSIFLNKVVE